MDVTRALESLSRITGVAGAMLVEAEAGVPVVEELAEGVHGGAVAALAAALYRRTADAAGAAGFGEVLTLQLEAEEGHVLVAGAGELIVVAIAEQNASLGMIRLQVTRAAGALR